MTYATRDTGATKTAPATYAPKSLNLAQLKAIFLCTDTNWKQVGGPNEPIKAYLPQVRVGHALVLAQEARHHRAGQLRQRGAGGEPGSVEAVQQPERDLHLLGRRLDRAEVPLRPCRARSRPRRRTSSAPTQIGFLGLNTIDGVSPITSAKVPSDQRDVQGDRLHADHLRHRPLRASTAHPHPGRAGAGSSVQGRTRLRVLEQDRDRGDRRATGSSRLKSCGSGLVTGRSTITGPMPRRRGGPSGRTRTRVIQQ